MKDGIKFAVTAEELRSVYQLRYKVYVEAMGRLADKADHSTRELHDEYDSVARALIAIKGGAAIGTLRLFWGGDSPFAESLVEGYRLAPFMQHLKESQICIVERLMVGEKHRGSITSLRMYEEVMHFVLDSKVEIVLLACEPHHAGLYMKLGFRTFTKFYNYPGIGPVIPMALIVGDYEHLKRVGSPFSQLLNKDDVNHCRSRDILQRIMTDESKQVYRFISKSDAKYNQLMSNVKEYLEHRSKRFDQASKDFSGRMRMKISA